MPEQIKYLLDEEQIPKSWYNLSADLPEPVPPVLLNYGSGLGSLYR